jgi:GTPase SAR1 family protein
MEPQATGKVVVVGNFSEKHVLIDRIANNNQTSGNNNFGSHPLDTKMATFRNSGGANHTVLIQDTASQEQFSTARKSYLRSANVVVLVSCANGTVNDVNAELDYYFNEVNQAVKSVVAQKTIVLIEEGGSNAIHNWCEMHGLDCVNVSTKTGEGIDDAYTMIWNRLAEQ